MSTRKRLISLFAAANKKNTKAAYDDYTAILRDKKLQTLFSLHEVADTYYNRALTANELADECVQRCEYANAQGWMRSARSDLHNAQIRYTVASHVEHCETLNESYEEKRKEIIAMIHSAEEAKPSTRAFSSP